MLYNNWIHKLSENYVNSRLGINEEKKEYHPHVTSAAKKLKNEMGLDHSVEEIAGQIHSHLDGEEATPKSVASAAGRAAGEFKGMTDYAHRKGMLRGGKRPSEDEIRGNVADRVGQIVHDHLEPKEVKESTLTESEMILEELNETKEYAAILEHILNTLIENEIVNEEMISEVLHPEEVFDNLRNRGIGTKEKASDAAGKRGALLSRVAMYRDKLVNNKIKLHPDADVNNNMKMAKIAHIDALLKGTSHDVEGDEKRASTLDRIHSGHVSPSALPHMSQLPGGEIPAQYHGEATRGRQKLRADILSRKKKAGQAQSDYNA